MFGLFSKITYGQKLFLLATIPLILAVAAIATLVVYQTNRLSEQELQALETELLAAKESELQNYMSIARQSYGAVYGKAGPYDEGAKLRVTQILSSLTYGNDGFFFVYDYDGTNLVSPRQTYLINQNWMGVENTQGRHIADEIVTLAKSGGGYLRYQWPQPSTGKTAQMVTYVISLPDWRWAVGTGVFIDDVISELAATRAETQARIKETSFWIMGITVIALVLVFISGMILNIRERRLADAKLKQLTQRIFDTQEEERIRVARELHDGISQILIGVRYALDLALRRISKGDQKAGQSIKTGREGLTVAISEVRRISHDLRPGILDDLGLGPALKALVEDFSERTGIQAEFETVVFRDRLTPDAKTALYRVAQEALTNVERHANATKLSVRTFGHRKGATLRIQDNGQGVGSKHDRTGGLGLRNMQERIEHLNGTISIQSTKDGTLVEAQLPITHMLTASAPSKKAAV